MKFDLQLFGGGAHQTTNQISQPVNTSTTEAQHYYTLNNYGLDATQSSQLFQTIGEQNKALLTEQIINGFNGAGASNLIFIVVILLVAAMILRR